MKKYVISILVDNHPGVLCRLSGLFSRRGYNIDSITVGTTLDPKISRMTIVGTEDEQTVEQIIRQLEKQVDVRQVVLLEDGASVQRELVLLKLDNTRNRAMAIAASTSGIKIVDAGEKTVTIQIAGGLDEVNQMIKMFGEHCKIVEMARAGAVALQSGDCAIGLNPQQAE